MGLNHKVFVEHFYKRMMENYQDKKTDLILKFIRLGGTNSAATKIMNEIKIYFFNNRRRGMKYTKDCKRIIGYQESYGDLK